MFLFPNSVFNVATVLTPLLFLYSMYGLFTPFKPMLKPEVSEGELIVENKVLPKLPLSPEKSSDSYSTKIVQSS